MMSYVMLIILCKQFQTHSCYSLFLFVKPWSCIGFAEFFFSSSNLDRVFLSHYICDYFSFLLWSFNRNVNKWQIDGALPIRLFSTVAGACKFWIDQASPNNVIAWVKAQDTSLTSYRIDMWIIQLFRIFNHWFFMF